MKNRAILFLVIGIFAIITSCSKSPSDMIVGEWRITNLQTTSDIPEDQLEAYNEQMEEMKKSSKIIFNEDGTFEQTILDETAKGKWNIDETGKILSKKNDDGNSENLTLSELTDNKMVTISKFDDITNTTTFEKVKK